MDKHNGPLPEMTGKQVITMSHFLPLEGPSFLVVPRPRTSPRLRNTFSFSRDFGFLPVELLPAKEKLHYPWLAKIVGSTPLATQVQRLQPSVHVFGHTHIKYAPSACPAGHFSPLPWRLTHWRS